LAQRTPHEISVLVVDDDQDITDDLAEYLERNGYAATRAYTGENGLALIKQQRHDIALVDLKLPDINGIELLKSFKASSPRTIIVLISGYATIDAAAEAIRYGAYDFIAKPFSFDELERTLRGAIEKKTQTERLNRLRKRNLILALTLPLWFLIGYFIVHLFS
jgi:DNA-binding NtrC family response regulator